MDRDNTGRRGPPPGLSAADFVQSAVNGFGDPQNAYVHSMTFFKDQVLAGTSRHSMALLKLFPPQDPPRLDPWPVEVPGSVEDLDLRGQIWRWQPGDQRWERIHRSPTIKGKNGRRVPRDLGYRGMAVFQGASDREPALYVSSISTVLRGTAARLLRSSDGVTFSPVSEPGLGNPNISSLRSLAAFDGHLFVPPAGEGITFNSNRSSVVLRSPDPATGGWEQACEPGFGDPTNSGIFELAAFNDHLYAGTFNHHEGYQIWKTPATGSAPCRWKRVVAQGADRGRLSEIAMSMCVFDDALYIGSAIQNGGYDRNNHVGPAAGEIIRIFPDDSWELVLGTPRRTTDGTKYPLSGMGPGFDNIFAGYIWRMAVHEGWLYASTFDWSVFLPYAQKPSYEATRIVRGLGIDTLLPDGGGFELWRTRDGVHWVPVTRNGMGNPYNYGGRTLTSTPYGLFVGTANPFGPMVAAQLAAGWAYVRNPSGGAEVWQGETQTAPQSGSEPGARLRSRDQAPPARKVRRSPRVLVTGATGFIGSHVMHALLQRDERVRVLALPETVDDIVGADTVEVVVGDLGDPAALTDAVDGVEIVFHLAAALPGTPYAPLREVNVAGTRALLQACTGTVTLRRVVFASSVAVYEGAFIPRAWPMRENSPLGPRGPAPLRRYGMTKVAGEILVRQHAAGGDAEFVILRPSTCYGTGGRFATNLVRHALGSPPTARGLGPESTLQLLHVRDLADLIVRVGSGPESANETFNVAGAESCTYDELARMIRRIAGRTDWTARRPSPDSVWRRYVRPYDITRARRVVGFMPRTTMHEGLEEVLASMDVADGHEPLGQPGR